MEKYKNTKQESARSDEKSMNSAEGWELVASMADQMPEESLRNEAIIGTTQILPADDQNSVELERSLGTEKLHRMQETWGNFAQAQQAGIFGPKTEMNQYEYGSLAERLSWAEFSNLADQAYDSGYKSYEEYQKTLYQIGDKLRDENVVSDWRQFGLVVKRYNIAKHFGEIEKNSKWRSELSIYETETSLSSRHGAGRIGGEMMALDLEQGGEIVSAIHQNRQPGKVSWFWNRDIMDDDGFDVFGGRAAIRNPSINDVYGVVVDDVATLETISRHKTKNQIQTSVPLFTKQEWQNGHTDSEEYNRELRQLTNDAIFNVDKQAVNDFVNHFLEKVDASKLQELGKIMKDDYRNGASETVRYFSEVFGFKEPDLEIVAKRDVKKILGDSVSGSQTGVVESNMRLRIAEQDLKHRPKEAVDTIAHEMFHMKQKLLVYQWLNGKLQDPNDIRHAELYSICNNYYEISSKSYSLYRHQLVEEEAHAFGSGVKKKMQGHKSLREFFSGFKR